MANSEQTDDRAGLGADIRVALGAGDAGRLTELLDPLPYSEALRELLSLPPAERDTVLESASGPLLTTITDMAGFFLVLSLATLMMPWLN